MRIVVTTYNIHRFIGRDGLQDRERIVRVLRRINPHFAALQEVESRGTAMLESLAAEEGFFPIAGPTMLTAAGQYGNALLSRYPPHQVRRHDISYRDREPRGVIEACFRLNSGTVRLLTTHLGLKPMERRWQAKKLLDIVAAAPDDPEQVTILLGDINEWYLWGRPLRWLHRYFGNSPAVRTFPSGWPLLALDRIWCHPRKQLRHVHAERTATSRQASDHLPLVAAIDL